MSKSILKELRRDSTALISMTAEIEGSGWRHFEILSAEYGCLQLSSNDDDMYSVFRRFFRLYISFMDDAMVLFTGKLCRSYHKSRHENLYSPGEGGSALHSRGNESAYSKHSEDFTRCSVDGFNYEYRKMMKRKDVHKYEEVLCDDFYQYGVL